MNRIERILYRVGRDAEWFGMHLLRWASRNDTWHLQGADLEQRPSPFNEDGSFTKPSLRPDWWVLEHEDETDNVAVRPLGTSTEDIRGWNKTSLEQLRLEHPSTMPSDTPQEPVGGADVLPCAQCQKDVSEADVFAVHSTTGFLTHRWCSAACYARWADS